MRHRLMRRLAAWVGVLLLGGGVLFAALAQGGGESRLETVLELEGDVDRGRMVTDELANPNCTECHSLADVDRESRIASDFDELQPSARMTVASILSGTIEGHDRYDYRHELSNQDLIDMARYLEEVAGAER